jgi:glutathione S-transferase
VIADPSTEPNDKPTYVSESFKIAIYLDDKYPAPHYPLIFPPGTRALQSILVTQYYPVLGAAMGPLIQPSIPGRLDDRGAEYWRRTRGHRFKQLSDEAAAKMWQEASQKWDALGKSLDFNNDTTEAGPFVMGAQVSFIDFAIGGVFHFLQRIEGEESARLKEMMEWQGGRWRVLREKIIGIEQNSSELV